MHFDIATAMTVTSLAIDPLVNGISSALEES